MYESTCPIYGQVIIYAPGWDWREVFIMEICLLPNLVQYTINSYQNNIELLKVFHQTFEGQNIYIPNLETAQKIIYTAYLFSAPAWGKDNEQSLGKGNIEN